MTCIECGEEIYAEDNGAGDIVWIHYFDSTVCGDEPPGSTDGSKTARTA